MPDVSAKLIWGGCTTERISCHLCSLMLVFTPMRHMTACTCHRSDLWQQTPVPDIDRQETCTLRQAANIPAHVTAVLCAYHFFCIFYDSVISTHMGTSAAKSIVTTLSMQVALLDVTMKRWRSSCRNKSASCVGVCHCVQCCGQTQTALSGRMQW